MRSLEPCLDTRTLFWKLNLDLLAPDTLPGKEPFRGKKQQGDINKVNGLVASRKQLALLGKIRDFAKGASGYEIHYSDPSSNDGFSELTLIQTQDRHRLHIKAAQLEELLLRTDAEGTDFLQINFVDTNKILLTEKLIGFKPKLHTTMNFDEQKKLLSRLPKVVTTPDILSVIDSFEEAIFLGENEVDLLAQLFEALTLGAEAVGFDVSLERARLLPYFPHLGVRSKPPVAC